MSPCAANNVKKLSVVTVELSALITPLDAMYPSVDDVFWFWLVTLPNLKPSSINIKTDPVLGLSSSSPGHPTAAIAPYASSATLIPNCSLSVCVSVLICSWFNFCISTILPV